MMQISTAAEKANGHHLIKQLFSWIRTWFFGGTESDSAQYDENRTNHKFILEI